MLVNQIEGAGVEGVPSAVLPPQTELSSRVPDVTPRMCAAQSHSARPEGHCPPTRICRADTCSGDRVDAAPLGRSVASDVADDLSQTDARHARVIGDIVIHHRRYADLRRAYQRLDLQTKAIKRFAGEGAPVELWLEPYYAAMAPLELAAKAEEKYLAKLAKGLPVYDWAKGINGLSDRFLALVIGEAGRPISDYRSPAALWKRMGMAVIDGERQRRVSGEAALLHGYVARRRSLLWNIGESILKQQIRKNEAGERYAIGEYGQVYIDRRAYETEKNGEKYSHARAKRYMEKRLLRELWRAWRIA